MPAKTGQPLVKTRILTLLAAGILTLGADARAQSGENVLLIVNSTSPASQQIGDRYTRARAIPGDNILRLAMDASEEVSRQTYERQIERPIAAWLNRSAAHDRILYIVLTKGTPLRIAGSSGRSGTVASVDSELSLLYRKLLGISVAPQGSVPNPYFLGDRPVTEAKPFTHETFDLYLVTRLDGFSTADVLALIDRGTAPTRSGRFALDEKVSLATESGNRWLERSAELLKTMGMGDRVLLDSTIRVVNSEKDLLGYYSWGSNDPFAKTRDLKLGFAPGALAATFVSTDGRTFKEPPAEWAFGSWDDRRSFFEGSPQSLTGDLIRAGATGVAGHVAEPYLDATVRPDVLFPAYVSGFNLAESFYLGIPYLSWQTIVIGDPLCAPCRRHTLTASEIDRGIDPATELPLHFSARVLQMLAKSTAVPEAARLVVRGNGRIARGDRTGGQQAFEQATSLDPRLSTAHLLLAGLYNQRGEHDKAIDRYRRVLSVEPNNTIALNDLAYSLATHGTDAMQEALTLARKAYTLANGNPSIADSLAWILHLAGNDAEARRVIGLAVRGAPDNAEINLHAATIDAALGAYDAAMRELVHATELNPEFEKQADVQDLRAKIGRPRP